MSVAEHSAADATEATEAADLDQTQEGEEEGKSLECQALLLGNLNILKINKLEICCSYIWCAFGKDLFTAAF